MYYKYDVDGHETTFYGASLNSYMTTGGVKYKNLERPWEFTRSPSNIASSLRYHVQR